MSCHLEPARRRFGLKAALFGAVVLLVLPQAHASFIIGQAAQYAFIAGPNATSIQISNSTFNGNVSADANPTPGGNYVQFSSGTINGNFDFAGTAQANLGSGTLNGSKNSNVAAVPSAYNTILTLSSLFAGESGTAIAGSGSFNAASGIADPNGNEVFTTAASSFLQSGTLTVNGSANDYVVINVTGQNNVQLKNALLLSGGITDDHVFINVTGTNQQIGGNTNGGANGGAINGLFVAINDKFNVDNTVFSGRIIGGDSSDFQLLSGIKLTAPPAPEPASLVVLAIPMTAALLRRRQRRAQ